MAANNRATARPPGRTPPFILVGLVVLVGILGYNYWSLSSANSVLSSDLEIVRIEKKSIDDKFAEIEKNLENSREEQRRTEGSLEQTRQQLDDKEKELTTLKSDYSRIEGETRKLKESLDQCDNSLVIKGKDLESANEERSKLQTALEDERQKPINCDFGSCTNHIKAIIGIVSTKLGSDAVGKILEENQLEAAKLMEGLEYIPPPKQEHLQESQAGENQLQSKGNPNQPQSQQQVDPNQKQAVDNQSQQQPKQQGQDQQNGDQEQQPAEKQDQLNNEVNKDDKVKEMSIDSPSENLTPAETEAKDFPNTLLFESNNGETAIVTKDVKEEIEKAIGNRKNGIDAAEEEDNATPDKADIDKKKMEKDLSYDDYDGADKDEYEYDKEVDQPKEGEKDGKAK